MISTMIFMKFIDVHTHPGFDDPLFQKAAKDNKIDYTENGYFLELKQNGVSAAVAIGWNFGTNNTMAKLSEKNNRIIPIFGVHIDGISKYASVAQKALKEQKFKGFKIFLGYEYDYPYSRLFEPIYKLAEKYDVPVIFHTGDTWSPYVRGRVKFSHPLGIDELAFKHPDMKILLAHSGNPWIDDAAEVIYKNENCYADISGWFLGNLEPGYKELMKSKLNTLVQFATSKKLMFGTDWPLINVDKYITFLKESGLKEEYIENIAYRTATKFWGVKI